MGLQLVGSDEGLQAALRGELDAAAAEAEEARREQVVERFAEVLEYLSAFDLEDVWATATDVERRVLLDELLDRVAVFPDHLEVTVHGAPTSNVLLKEVGLVEKSGFRSCRRGDLNPHALAGTSPSS